MDFLAFLLCILFLVPLNVAATDADYVNTTYHPCGASYHLLGCYRDTEDRDLSGYISYDPVGMTVRSCYYTCRWKNFKYFAVQEGYICSCGNSYGKYGSLNHTNCKVPCTGEPIYTCGGVWANLVYNSNTYRDINCEDSYYVKMKTLDSIYENCTINVGGCHKHRCDECGTPLKSKECVPKYHKETKWCGPGDKQRVKVVKKCRCKRSKKSKKNI